MKRVVLNFSWLYFLIFSLVLVSCQDSLDDTFPERENASNIQSKIITIAQAKETAVKFMNQNGKQAKGLPNFTEEFITEVQTIENDKETPIMYALNLGENNGFVVMSASLVERPILAYSHEGKFDFENIGDYSGVADWALTKYLKINGLLEIGNEPSGNIINQWNAVNPSLGLGLVDNDGNIIPWDPPVIVDQWDDIETYGPHLSTTWNQRLGSTPGASVIGYNNFVRFNNCTSGVAPVGCVATAMGQIMKFHNWPNIYSINTMPNIVNSSNYTTTIAHNVGYFMQDIGIKVAMDYACDASGAYSTNARTALVTHYNYNASGVVGLSFNPLTSDLKSSKPVYLDGCRTREIKTRPRKVGIFGWTIGKTTYSYKNCHAWVADGFEVINRTVVYDTGHSFTSPIAEHIHMNWGWGNSGWNGWYDYESWDDINGVDFSQIDYIYSQDMIHNITPR